ncbi:MAG: hypothetical protein JNM51_03255, partial [Bacteroidia bacterium]|nr:hypothetical protein [Bacteroidia bacterium]
NHHKSEAGEGWLVLLTDEGLKEIKALNYNMEINKILKRIKGAEDVGPSRIIRNVIKVKH